MVDTSHVMYGRSHQHEWLVQLDLKSTQNTWATPRLFHHPPFPLRERPELSLFLVPPNFASRIGEHL
jgi:hypothetical protein